MSAQTPDFDEVISVGLPPPRAMPLLPLQMAGSASLVHGAGVTPGNTNVAPLAIGSGIYINSPLTVRVQHRTTATQSPTSQFLVGTGIYLLAVPHLTLLPGGAGNPVPFTASTYTFSGTSLYQLVPTFARGAEPVSLGAPLFYSNPIITSYYNNGVATIDTLAIDQLIELAPNVVDKAQTWDLYLMCVQWSVVGTGPAWNVCHLVNFSVVPHN